MADRDGVGLEGLGDLEGWAADARAREAAEARVRERWLRTQAEEDARLASVLAGLAERRTEAVATTTAGHHVSGCVTAVGQDFLALTGPAARLTLVPLAALAWVRPTGDRMSGRGRRRPVVALGPEADDPELPDGLVGGLGGGGGAPATLADVLAHAAAQRPRVSVRAPGATLTGDLRAVGMDVLVIETSGEPPSLAYVRLQSLSDISLLTSG